MKNYPRKVLKIIGRARAKTCGFFKRLFYFSPMFLSLGADIMPRQAVGLPITTISRPALQNRGSSLSKEIVINSLIDNRQSSSFSKIEMDCLRQLGLEYKNNSLTEEELIHKIANLRGGGYVNIIAALAIIGAILILLMNDIDISVVSNPFEYQSEYVDTSFKNNDQAANLNDEDDCINLNEIQGKTIMDVLKELKNEQN